MKFSELYTYAKIYMPAYMLDKSIKPRNRIFLRKTFFVISGILGVVVMMDLVSKTWPHVFSTQPFVSEHISIFLGVFLLASVGALKMFMLEAFYLSHISNVSTSSIKKKGGTFYPITYDVSRVIFKTPTDDVLLGFLSSYLVTVVMDRLGIPQDEIKRFLSMRKEKISTINFSVISKSEVVTFPDYSRAVYSSSSEFSAFLLSYGVTEKLWGGAVDWISRVRYRQIRERRFWSREILGRIPSLGKDWAFGKAWTLMKYANLVQEEPLYRSLDESLFVFYRKEFEEVEAVLTRASGANALVVSEDPENAMDLVVMLGMAIDRGYAYPQIEGKRVFLLRPSVLLNGISTKQDFEQLFIEIFKEARDSGNIILAIENFSTLIDAAYTYGTDIVSLLGIFLSSPELHVVALIDKHRYHDSLEPHKAITSLFEKVTMQEKDRDAVLHVLEDRVLSVEAREKVFITYAALCAIVENSERYFSDSFLYEKAKNILVEIGPFVRRQGKKNVSKEDVLALFEEKTGIPQGIVRNDEKEKLLNIETSLHQRVIGQDEAVSAIANALRRSRAGVGNPRRPIGSFLFLGPTGVGKTETTKALAQTFFGDEDAIVRFDMSEYKTDDSLKRLIGSFEGEKSGVLSTKLREKPYCILLLDEFEKTNKEVLDLFLQILDEGFFSDMEGNKVNVRNAIIIATSNAGSDIIFECAKNGGGIQNKKTDIISSIISQGIFKPELINRFDGTILFEPLKKEELKKIAGIMLIKLESRLREKGIKLQVTDELIEQVALQGMDPAFGARPMNRYIQEKIEALVADKIIRGQINQGDAVVISGAEL